MESSSSSFKTFWRKPLTRRFRHIYWTLAVIAACLLFVFPTFLSWSFLNNLNKESELAELLYKDSMSKNDLMVLKKELEDYDQLQARLESIDPDSAEYESAKSSYDSLRQEIADTMPSLVTSYDEDGLPVLMTYKEYVRKNIK